MVSGGQGGPQNGIILCCPGQERLHISLTLFWPGQNSLHKPYQPISPWVSCGERPIVQTFPRFRSIFCAVWSWVDAWMITAIITLATETGMTMVCTIRVYRKDPKGIGHVAKDRITTCHPIGSVDPIREQSTGSTKTKLSITTISRDTSMRVQMVNISSGQARGIRGCPYRAGMETVLVHYDRTSRIKTFRAP
jgi:hypothetical protein